MCQLRFLLAKEPLKLILGVNACTALGLLSCVKILDAAMSSPRTLPQKQHQQVLDEFADIFDGIGQLPGLYSIDLRDGATPRVCAPCRIPCALEDEVKRELKRMEQNGVIVPVTEHSEWVHQIVVVTKKRWDYACMPGSSQLKCSSQEAPLPNTTTSGALCKPKWLYDVLHS